MIQYKPTWHCDHEPPGLYDAGHTHLDVYVRQRKKLGQCRNDFALRVTDSMMKRGPSSKARQANVTPSICLKEKRFF
jgi:hypothetical protein